MTPKGSRLPGQHDPSQQRLKEQNAIPFERILLESAASCAAPGPFPKTPC
ncbi:hypothetical protein MPC4_210003 [Methylocella tundrae]|uniref:Uncharacterized protein n=1 Tax=Methylocella tundrae TaxID=227605 RepID=A0A8B6M5Z8_METTU|nr:hypothetical protein MPC1_8990003 [Methylocella tundrae]VTZ50196.1 hypothetical protein MPC4_210003 [Methylocella tundrae]